MKHLLLPALLLAAACGSRTTAAPQSPAAAESAPAEAASPTARTPATDFELNNSRLVLPGPIVFTNDALDTAGSEAALWHIHDYLVAKDFITLLRIEGHGDQAGDEALMYSGAQALAVGEWLVAHGIDCKRLLAVAFGDSKPIADPSTPEGRAQNRRIEVVNAELRGRAIGGMPIDGGGVAAPVCD